MSTTRPRPKYPAQSNLQTDFATRDTIDAVAHLAGLSRAEVMRQCFAEALDTVSLRLGVRPAVRAAAAKAIARGRRSGSDE